MRGSSFNKSTNFALFKVKFAMDKLEKLVFYRKQLKLLADFLECYLPLANAHTVDFLVDDMWMSDVPELLRTQLLCLKPHELVILPEKSPESSKDGDYLGSEISQDRPNDSHPPHAAGDCDNIKRPKLNRRLKCSWRHNTLKHFVEAAHMHTLKHLDVLSAKDNLPMEQGKSFHMRDFMCAKKAHEVEVMAALCSSLCDKHNVDQVVDIGSGLGYLSGHLAFLHNLKVLGIDSSNTNTHGADKRSARLTKHWPLLLANAQLSQLGLPPVRTKGKNKLKNQKKSSDSGHSENLDVKPEDYIPPEKFEALATKLKAAKQLSPKGCFEPVTMYVTEETDLVALIKEHFKDSSIQPSSECATRENTLGCNSGKISNSETFVLTGLHTCGGLASSILRLFLSNTNAVCVCNVGCCYHLLDEEFVRGPFEKDDDPVPSEFGFPLSECLLNRNFYLGRNARMLACQAPARLADATEGQERMGPECSLHWRAVLQVILCDVTDERRDDWNIGRLASKCSGFVEYVTKALKKLNITHKLTDSDITAYEKKFVESEKHMKCFFYLRATLAACIESLILLDRLVYLLEQDCVTDACLVELFDPKLSPRCWAVIASK